MPVSVFGDTLFPGHFFFFLFSLKGRVKEPRKRKTPTLQEMSLQAGLRHLQTMPLHIFCVCESIGSSGFAHVHLRAGAGEEPLPRGRSTSASPIRLLGGAGDVHELPAELSPQH